MAAPQREVAISRTWIALTLGITALVTGGCGTVCNLAGGVVHPDEMPMVYGGVQVDAGCIGKIGNGSASTADAAKGRLFLVGLGLVDMSVSFVADTLTLPLTVYVQQRRTAAEDAACRRIRTSRRRRASRSANQRQLGRWALPVGWPRR